MLLGIYWSPWDEIMVESRGRAGWIPVLCSRKFDTRRRGRLPCGKDHVWMISGNLSVFVRDDVYTSYTAPGQVLSRSVRSQCLILYVFVILVY